MEILGGLLLVMIALTLLGSVTALAFASMAVLGLTTEMSFRRLFFTSFGIGLLAPLLLGMWVSSKVAEEDFQLELLTELNQAVSGSEGVVEALPRIRELRQQLSDGTITRDEFERQIEQLVEETAGTQIERDGAPVTPELVTPESVTPDAEPQAERVPEGG